MPNIQKYDNIVSVEAVNAFRGSDGRAIYKTRLHGQAVKTPPFHGGNRGSNPLGVIALRSRYADVAQLAEQLICNQQVIGSSPIIGFIYGPLAQLVRATGS